MKGSASSTAALAIALAAGLNACSAGGGPASAGTGAGTTATGGSTTGSGVAASGGAGPGSGAGISGGGSGDTTVASGSSASGTGSGAPAATTGSAVSGSADVPVKSAPVTAVKGPDVTFTEFKVPTNASPGGICAGPDGRIWFLHQDTGPSANGAITTTGTFSPVYKVSVTNIGPIAITPGPDGNIWYTKQQGIGRMTPAGQFTEFGAPGGAQTAGITKGPDGNLWFSERDVDRIGKITPSGQATDFPISPNAGTGRTPADITLGPDNNLWFTETTANKIGRITMAGVVPAIVIRPILLAVVSVNQRLLSGPSVQHRPNHARRGDHRVWDPVGRQALRHHGRPGWQSVVHGAGFLQRHRPLHTRRRYLRVPHSHSEYECGRHHGRA